MMSTPALLALLSLVTVPCVGAPGEQVARGGRPTLSGTEQVVVSEDGFFALHYTEQGVDRVQSVEDIDGNGLADVLDEVFAGLATARAAYRARGYRELVRDRGGGGGPELDVYIVDLANNGFANAVPAQEAAEPWSCYIRLAADLTSRSGEILDSVAAHELNHCVQYRYTINSATWIYESTATFEQYSLYESGLLDLALQVLWGSRLSGARRSLDDVGNRFEYAGFNWWKFWNEYQPGGERMVPLWQALADDPSWRTTLDSMAQSVWGQDLAALFLEYATWNAFACGRDDGAHYDETTMACILETISVPVDAIAVGDEVLVRLDPGDYTAAYLELQASGGADAVSLQCSGPGPQAEAFVRLIALDEWGARGAEQTVRVANDAGVSLRLDQALAPAGAALVVVAAVGEQPLELRCTVQWLEPVLPPVDDVVDSGCQCLLSASPTAPGGGGWLLLGLLVGGARRRR